ncbi:hypothetical protein GCM10010218_29540 [Streptomyces mashuensis]|uniref:DUF3592 domain-containing protein n=2 Tax=Streptomyces mashuensis TaxID=33904 RepID=A0A919B3D7_9ACTN|nr:hypothetical protein GCM10010218_29540 [Streptomyces mashuensis]
MAVVLALAASIPLFFFARPALEEERAYTASAVCTTGGRDCRHTVAATVDKTETESTGKKSGPYYWLSLTEKDGTAHRLRMDGEYPVFANASRGDAVTVTYWRDRIRSVELGNLRQSTAEDPRGAYRMPTAIGLTLLALAYLFAWSACWTARWAGRTRAAFPRELRVPAVVFTLLVGGAFGAPFVTDGPGPAALLVAGAAVVVTALSAVWTAAMRRRHTDDTVPLVPRVPDEEKVFPGVVHGEVPYDRPGRVVLVVGPGVFATSLDPTGTSYRTAVPRTLVPVRVRPPYVTDPHAGAYPKFLTLECLDGETPVFISAAEKHLPWVLGMLGAPVQTTAPQPASPK